MSEVVIRVENLGKRYRLGGGESYLALRDVLTRALSSPWRIFQRRKSVSPNGDARHFWALRGVSFEIQQGDLVGVIGRNGAGKSTLLKILSRVTKPTEGSAQVRGRIGSLLEVGTGFHGELTGRENTYLNGAILGMSKREITRKFDEIVAFAEIEKFIDTPVKYYSSGMYVRLAFAVAAHLETEILLVDEVLAVGDVAFQKKCLGKMGNVARQGRTVLFVSHSMGAITSLCKTCMVLGGGRIMTIAPTPEAVADYLDASADRQSAVYYPNPHRPPDAPQSREVEFQSMELTHSKLLPADADIGMRITVRGNETINGVRFSLTIYAVDGTPVGTCFGKPAGSIRAGESATYRVDVPNPGLAPGLYHIGMCVGTGNHQEGLRDFDEVVDVLHFEVLPPPGQAGTKSEWQREWGPVRLSAPVTTRCD